MSLQDLVAGVRDRSQPPLDRRDYVWNASAGSAAATVTADTHYNHRNPDLGIDFLVEKLGFKVLQAMDARVVRIAPHASNEKHRHAHESIFVVINGEGELSLGNDCLRLQSGSVAYVPRWITHQTHNTSDTKELTLLAITDFGLTSAILGDYDARTRLRNQGSDAFAPDLSLQQVSVTAAEASH